MKRLLSTSRESILRLASATMRGIRLRRSAGVEAAVSAGAFAGGPLPRLHVYTLCHNEHDIIPWFVAHYARFAERIIVYDNESTDDSVALLRASSPKVEVRSFSTDGECNDLARTRLRNAMWKDSKGAADLVVVCDMDEFLYHPRMEDFLRAFRGSGWTVLAPLGVQMVSETFPAWRRGALLTDEIRTGYSNPTGSFQFRQRSKWAMFDPDAIVDMGYGPGFHTARPRGRVRVFASDEAKLLHYDMVGRDRLFVKMRKNRDRMANEVLRKGLSRHYLVPEATRLKWFETALAKATTVI